jgi:hypothetical protein
VQMPHFSMCGKLFWHRSQGSSSLNGLNACILTNNACILTNNACILTNNACILTNKQKY